MSEIINFNRVKAERQRINFEELADKISFLAKLRSQIISTEAFKDALDRASKLPDEELYGQLQNASQSELTKHALWYCAIVDVIIARREDKEK